jgi:hypothetical protein
MTTTRTTDRTDPYIGETKLVDGRRAMCLNPCANYGGGSGPLWAVEGHLAEFTVHGAKGGYMLGRCRKVLPRYKVIAVDVLDGLTWGPYATGERALISCDRIGRYNNLRQGRSPLIQRLGTRDQELRSRQAFEETTIRELEGLLRQQYRKEIGETLGEGTTQTLEALVRHYINFCNGMAKSKGQAIRGMSKKMKSSKRQIEALLSGDVDATQNVGGDIHGE